MKRMKSLKRVYWKNHSTFIAPNVSVCPTIVCNLIWIVPTHNDNYQLKIYQSISVKFFLPKFSRESKLSEKSRVSRMSNSPRAKNINKNCNNFSKIFLQENWFMVELAYREQSSAAELSRMQSQNHLIKMNSESYTPLSPILSIKYKKSTIRLSDIHHPDIHHLRHSS